mgnify:CR=1 FL=1
MESYNEMQENNKHVVDRITTIFLRVVENDTKLSQRFLQMAIIRPDFIELADRLKDEIERYIEDSHNLITSNNFKGLQYFFAEILGLANHINYDLVAQKYIEKSKVK